MLKVAWQGRHHTPANARVPLSGQLTQCSLVAFAVWNASKPLALLAFARNFSMGKIQIFVAWWDASCAASPAQSARKAQIAQLAEKIMNVLLRSEKTSRHRYNWRRQGCRQNLTPNGQHANSCEMPLRSRNELVQLQQEEQKIMHDNKRQQNVALEKPKRR